MRAQEIGAFTSSSGTAWHASASSSEAATGLRRFVLLPREPAGGARHYWQRALPGRRLGHQESDVKWASMYLVGFVVLQGGILAALRPSGLLATSIGMAWTLFGVAMAFGIAIMLAVSNSGAKENIEIYWK